MIIGRSPEALLRVVSSLHRHRWPLEALRLEEGPAGTQLLTLRIGVDKAAHGRVCAVLAELIDVLAVDVPRVPADATCTVRVPA